MFKQKKLYVILTAIFATLCAITFIALAVCDNYSAAINMVLQAKTYEVVYGEDNEKPVNYYSSDYENVSGNLLREKDSAIIEETEGEGAVLLWNENSALPLKKTDKISLLGRASTYLVETGTGSGYVAKTEYSITLQKAFSEIGVSINTDLWNFYTSKPYYSDRANDCSRNAIMYVNELAWSAYTSAVQSTFAQYGDAAVVILARTGGEYSDLKTHGGDAPAGTGGNYLCLTDEEVELLRQVSSLRRNGVFKKFVLLLNTGNPVEFGRLQEFMPYIDAGMYIGQPGATGARAVAKLLVGDITPSGRLVDTYINYNSSAPAAANSDEMYYLNYQNYKDLKGQSLNAINQASYMVYQEGIYVGYKYYESRYEDCVLGSGNAGGTNGSSEGGAWNYSKEVVFPFGHGISYTTFQYSKIKFKRALNGDFTVSLTVSNTGTTSGKEVVEVYLQRPYTQYDKDNKLEQSAVQLAGFEKTALLAPGESQDITISVSYYDFATYDCNALKQYVVEAGKYYLALGTDSHAALNNILAAKGKTVFNGMTAEGDDSLVKAFDIGEDTRVFKNSLYNEGVAVGNQFDAADINKYENRGDNPVITYLSRNDWQGTYPVSYAVLSMNQGMAFDLTYDNSVVSDPSLSPLEYEQESELNLASLIKVDANGNVILDEKGRIITEDYDSPLWDELLDKMSWEEQALLCANAYHRLEGAISIAMPESKMENGPAGLTSRSGFPKLKGNDFVHLGYPCQPIIAGTWNRELANRLGKCMSEDMLYTGYTGIYGPGLNLHRTAFGGRAWEYYSEDSYLSGMMGIAQASGIENKGMLAFVKHFVMNDQEANRRHVGIWASEQTIREIYLRPYEMVFTTGSANATMNSFTRLGTTWCGANSALQLDVLRDEWNWKGINISDWDSGGPMSQIDGIMGGIDSFDGNNSASSYAQWKNEVEVQLALRRSTKHIIYTLAHTCLMNGLTPSARVIHFLPWWERALIGIGSGFGAITVICGTFLVIALCQGGKKKSE